MTQVRVDFIVAGAVEQFGAIARANFTRALAVEVGLVPSDDMSSAMIELAGGVQPASPMPTPTLNTSSERKLPAMPQRAVITDQRMTLQAMMRTRLKRSA